MIARCRSITGDKKKPYFWSDDEWRDRLNDAAIQACIRARLIEDDRVEIDLAAGDPYADYPAYVWSVRRAFFNGRKLDLVDRQMLDLSEGMAWEDAVGDPIAVYEVNGRLRFYPIPQEKGTARLVCFCSPQRPMTRESDKPGIPVERMHVGLVDWAVSVFYDDQDADTFDPAKAEKHAGKFTATFGPMPSESQLRIMRINVRRTTVGHYF